MARQTPFTSTTFYPARMWQASYFGDAGPRIDDLVVTPAQHRVSIGDATAIRRLYSELDLRLFYADDDDDNAALATAPAISDVKATIAGNIVTFAARVHGTDHNGADNLKSVWVTHTGGAAGCSCWDSVDLVPSDTDASIWTGTLDIGPLGIGPDDLRFIVQAANGAALVGINDNRAAYHSPASTAAGTPDATTLVLTAGPSTGADGANTTVSATLKKGATALSGKVVSFEIGSAFGTGTTNGSGVATATFPFLTLPDALQLVAKYEGDSTTAPSSDERSFTVTKLATQLTLAVGAGPVLGNPSGVSATLKAAGTGLPGRTIFFVIKGSGATAGQGFLKSVTTDAAGVGVLGAPRACRSGATRSPSTSTARSSSTRGRRSRTRRASPSTIRSTSRPRRSPAR